MTTIEQVDVLIIGSGPSGSSTALHLVQLDPSWAERIVIVDKAVHPREKLCGGGITHMGQNILADLGLQIETKYFDVREARIVYHDKRFSVFANPAFRIIRRDEFDHWLVRKAEERGVRVRQGEAVTGVEVTPSYVEITTDKRGFRAQVVVAADGSRSFVRRKLKWEDDSRVARLLEVLTPEDPRATAEFRENVAVFDFTPMDDDLQGYYWDFPSYVAGQPFMNRGVFDSRARPEKPKADLKEVLSQSMAERGRDMDDYTLKGHPIRWWSSRGQFSQPRVVLVGDAAGADPLFGEGISFALGYGPVAAASIADAFARQDFSFETYADRLKGQGLFRQLRVRTWAARYAYLLNYPWLARLMWPIVGFVFRRSRWNDPDYVPVRPPSLRLSQSGNTD